MTRFEGLKDVHYEGGIITCDIQYRAPKEGEFTISERMYSYLFVIEVDAKLPEGAEIFLGIVPV